MKNRLELEKERNRRNTPGLRKKYDNGREH